MSFHTFTTTSYFPISVKLRSILMTSSEGMARTSSDVASDTHVAGPRRTGRRPSWKIQRMQWTAALSVSVSEIVTTSATSFGSSADKLAMERCCLMVVIVAVVTEARVEMSPAPVVDANIAAPVVVPTRAAVSMFVVVSSDIIVSMDVVVSSDVILSMSVVVSSDVVLSMYVVVSSDVVVSMGVVVSGAVVSAGVVSTWVVDRTPVVPTVVDRTPTVVVVNTSVVNSSMRVTATVVTGIQFNKLCTQCMFEINKILVHTPMCNNTN